MNKGPKLKIKKGDEVQVISGSHKGKKGKVLEVFRERMRIIVEGVAMHKRHERATQDNPDGGVVEREGSIHYSNVTLKKAKAKN